MDHDSSIDYDIDGEGLMDLEFGFVHLRYLQPRLAGIGVEAWENTHKFKAASIEMVRAYCLSLHQPAHPG